MPRPTFFTRLRKVAPNVNRLMPKESMTLKVRGTYGTYELIIGPEYSYSECKRAKLRPHSRPMSLQGDLHHLYMEDERILPHPPRRAVANRLKATVIINGVKVQIMDADGDGTLVDLEPIHPESVHIAQAINLAGEYGMARLVETQRDGQLTQAAYRIIQDDIVASLRSVIRELAGGEVS